MKKQLFLLMVLTFAGWGVHAWPAPVEIVKPLDTRAGRGNRERFSYVTGPACGIDRFYNSDLEVSFWNRPDQLTFSLAKNDVWDRRYFGGRKKMITLEDVRRVCFSDKIGRRSDLGLPDAAHALYLAYDFPCPKPVGQIILRCPDLEGPGKFAAGRDGNGRLLVSVTKASTSGSIQTFLHRSQNLLVIRGNYQGLKHPLEFQLYRHKDTAPQGTSIAALANRNGKTGYDYSKDPDNGPLPEPEAGTDGKFFYIRQHFPAEKTFPNGFEYVMMGTVEGTQCELRAENQVTGAGAKLHIHPISQETYRKLPGWLKENRIAAERINHAESGSLAAARFPAGNVSFNLFVTVVTSRDANKPMRAARAELEAALKKDVDTIFEESATADEKELRQWRLSRVMHYNATFCTYADATPWHGDYHFNEGYFLETIVAGDAGTLEPRLRMFEEMLPALRRNAREVYGCRGICFPLVSYPIKLERVVYTNVTWEWGIENTAFMLQPFWQIFQYTQDREFLEKRAYPMMREGARFYADYVKKGEDGKFHVIPTVSQEHWGFTPKFRLNRDSVGALSFIKYHLNACIRASEILGMDSEERKIWRNIVEHLASYPTLATPEGPVFCDVRDAPRLLNYNITANLIMTLWAEDIGLDSRPELLEMARRTYRALPNKEHNVRPGYLRWIRLYLGLLKKPFLSSQGRVLSWPGRIHLYAGLRPDAHLNDQFSGLLAAGGFEVSAARAGNRIYSLRIKSRAGGPCRLANPWEKEEVKVMNMTSGKVILPAANADTISFPTEAGNTYAVLAGPELKLAGSHFQAREHLIGKWTFDRQENGLVSEATGQALPARLVGGAAVVPSRKGRALELDGPRAYARIERVSAFDFGANESFSVEADVLLTTENRSAIIPLVCSMASRRYCLTIDHGKAKFYLSSPMGNVYSFVQGRSRVTDGKWHRIRGVRAAADRTLRIYVDGRLEGTAQDFTSGDFSSQAPLTIGAYLWGDHSRFCQGLIDNVELKSLGQRVSKP